MKNIFPFSIVSSNIISMISLVTLKLFSIFKLFLAVVSVTVDKTIQEMSQHYKFGWKIVVTE